MSVREMRRKRAEDRALIGLQGFRERRRQAAGESWEGDAWVSARDVAAETGEPVRSTARALLRMVASGRVAAIIQAFRDREYRPRERRLYQLRTGVEVGLWPAWAMPLVAAARPAIEEVEDEQSGI